MRVLVTGATGFLGRRVVDALLAQDHQVRCLVHTPGKEERLPACDLDIHYGSVLDMAALRAATYDLDAVVHLVAVIRERGTATFDAVNRQGTHNVAAVAAEAGVGHFIHVSAIGAQDQSIYPYLHSKWLGEQEVERCGIPYSILRPSILFGAGDEFITTLAALARVLPAMPIAGSGANLLHPIAVEDMARCIVATANSEPSMGPIELGGPEHLTYLEVVQTVCLNLGVRRAVLPVPLSVMQGLARVMEALLPSPPATREQLRMAVLPNIAELDSVYRRFDFHPRPLEGNIDFIKNITLRDGLRMAAGFKPARPLGD